MKIVVNRQYGGFGLSPIALQMWAKRKGRECYFFVHPENPLDLHKLIPASIEDAEKALTYFAFDIPDGNKLVSRQENWWSMTEDEKKASNAEYDKHDLYARDIPRNDPDLVAVIEEAGDVANTRFSNLEVVEIPDDVEWEIEEYDDREWVSEKHRTW